MFRIDSDAVIDATMAGGPARYINHSCSVSFDIREIKHLTMFTLHLPLAVFSFSEKLSSFALASEARIILHYFHLSTHFFKKI